MRILAGHAVILSILLLVTACPVEQAAADYFAKWGDSAPSTDGSSTSTGGDDSSGALPTTSGGAGSSSTSTSGEPDTSTSGSGSSTGASSIGIFPIDEPPQILGFTVAGSSKPAPIFDPGPVELRLDCVDDGGVQSIEFLRDGEPLADGDPATGLATWVINSHAFDGMSQISARCTDTAGQVIETDVPIAVSVMLPEPGSVLVTGSPPKTTGASEATAAAFDPESSELWVTGYQDAAIGGTAILLQRYGVHGELLLDKPIGFGKDVIAVAHGIAAARNHDVVLVGCVTKPNELPRAWFARYDSAGTKIWQQDGESGECGLDVALAEDLGSAYVAGQQILGPKDLDAVLRRLHFDTGGQQGKKTIDGGYQLLDTATTVEVDASGDVYFGGATSTVMQTTGYVRRTSPNLTELWTFGSPIVAPAEDGVQDLTVTHDGSVLSTGWYRGNKVAATQIFARRHSPVTGEIDGLDILEPLGLMGSNAGQGVAATADDEPVVAATIVPDKILGYGDISIRLYEPLYGDPDGWKLSFNGLAGRDDQARGIVAGPWGHVAAVGFQSVWMLDAMQQPQLRRQAWVRVLFP